MSMTYWSSGRCFHEDHGRALRYITDSSADKAATQPNFPKEENITTRYCNQCGIWHITRPSKLPLNVG